MASDNDYPVHNFPPLMRELAIELHENCGVPVELAALLTLGVSALACQGGVQVTRPNCDPSPCALFILLIAGSGTRKTTALHKLLVEVLALEQDLVARLAECLPEQEAAVLTWEVQRKALLKQIERVAKKNEPVDRLQSQLSDLMAARPSNPVAPKFVYEDPTPEAIVEGLCKNWHSAAVVSSEGGSFLNGRSSSDLSLWNRLWDGKGVSVERVGRGVVSSKEALASLIIAVQERPLQDFYDTRGEKAIDIGFLCRFVVSCPPRLIGSRFLPAVRTQPKWDALTAFRGRTRALLEEQVGNPGERPPKPRTLVPSLQAEHRWIDGYNKIEAMIRPGEYFAAVPGYASKIAENAARIAAIFHTIEGKAGDEIDFEDMDRAFRICAWHAEQFMSCFGPSSQFSPERRYAKKLEDWLLDHVWMQGKTEVLKNHIRQFGPNSMRKRDVLEMAYQVLISEDKIRFSHGYENAIYIQLNPNFFTWLGGQRKCA